MEKEYEYTTEENLVIRIVIGAVKNTFPELSEEDLTRILGTYVAATVNAAKAKGIKYV